MLSKSEKRLVRQFMQSGPRNTERLTMPWHERPQQHPGRREHIYGRVHAMDCKCGACNG